jgi:hypothetical protein
VFGALTEGVAAHLPAPRANVPRLLLHSDGLAPRIANLDEWAWHMIDELRMEAFLPADEETATLPALRSRPA